MHIKGKLRTSTFYFYFLWYACSPFCISKFVPKCKYFMRLCGAQGNDAFFLRSFLLERQSRPQNLQVLWYLRQNEKTTLKVVSGWIVQIKITEFKKIENNCRFWKFGFETKVGLYLKFLHLQKAIMFVNLQYNENEAVTYGHLYRILIIQAG